MHALWAIYNRRGGPIARSAQLRMVRALAHRPRERVGYHCGEGWWLGALSWPTHQRERDEQQPLRWVDKNRGDLTIVLDGRIDNRDALWRQLPPGPHPRQRPAGDAALVLNAYRRWGLDAFRRIIGDYALVLFDEAQQTLVAARDPSGMRPLYATVSAERAAFASELSALRALDNNAPPDEDSVVERLLNTVSGNDRTLYQGIRRLPPAHLWVITPKRETRRRFYNWRDTNPLPASTAGDYTKQFRTCLSEAVRCRLDATQPIALELSGGLDSSSICVLASRPQQPPQVELYAQSLVFPGLPCDERRYIEAVLGHIEMDHQAFEATPLTITRARAQARRDGDVPAYPNGVMSRGLRLAAQARGSRVVVSGSGSDEWWTGSRLDGAERLRRGEWSLAWEETMRAAQRGAVGRPRWLDVVRALRLSLGPWLPWHWRQRYHQRRHSQPPWPWIAPALLSRTHSWERMQQPPRRERSHDWTLQDVIDIVESGWVYHAYEMEAREAASYGLELRAPFTDRRLCALAVALPLAVRARRGGSKYLLRQAMRRDVGWRGLPDVVRTRTDKAAFSHLYVAALQCGERALRSRPLQVASRGWVHQAHYWRAVTAVLSRARALPGGPVVDARDSTVVQLLWAVMALELWLQSAQPT